MTKSSSKSSCDEISCATLAQRDEPLGKFMDRYEFPSVLICAEDLHGHATGYSDHPSSEVEARICEFLKMRLDTWKPSVAGTKKYDDAVRNLIQTALYEFYEFQGSHWTKPHTRVFRCECGCSVFKRVEQTPGLISRKCITCGRVH